LTLSLGCSVVFRYPPCFSPPEWHKDVPPPSYIVHSGNSSRVSSLCSCICLTEPNRFPLGPHPRRGILISLVVASFPLTSQVLTLRRVRVFFLWLLVLQHRICAVSGFPFRGTFFCRNSFCRRFGGTFGPFPVLDPLQFQFLLA